MILENISFFCWMLFLIDVCENIFADISPTNNIIAQILLSLFVLFLLMGGSRVVSRFASRFYYLLYVS